MIREGGCYYEGMSIPGGYDSHASGFLRGGGIHQYRRVSHQTRHKPLRHFDNVQLSDRSSIRKLVPNFDPALEFEYTPRELLLLAEKILIEDPKPWNEIPYVMTLDRMKRLAKREIYCSSGTPEPHIVSGIFFRSHPNGRRLRSVEERRKQRKSWYV